MKKELSEKISNKISYLTNFNAVIRYLGEHKIIKVAPALKNAATNEFEVRIYIDVKTSDPAEQYKNYSLEDFRANAIVLGAVELSLNSSIGLCVFTPEFMVYNNVHFDTTHTEGFNPTPLFPIPSSKVGMKGFGYKFSYETEACFNKADGIIKAIIVFDNIKFVSNGLVSDKIKAFVN